MRVESWKTFEVGEMVSVQPRVKDVVRFRFFHCMCASGRMGADLHMFLVDVVREGNKFKVR